MPNTPLNKEELRELVERMWNTGMLRESGSAATQKNIDEISDFVDKLLADRDAAVREAELKAEIRIHDEYWHSQRLVDKNGIGPVALANKEATELELRKLQSQPNAKEEE